MRILIADDNRDAADCLALLLSLEGHELRVAYDGTHALAVAATFVPRLAILDIGMPGIDGYGVARRIRDQPWGARMYLVALTGWAQPRDRQLSREAGFDLHFSKPLEPDVLVEILRKTPLDPSA